MTTQREVLQSIERNGFYSAKLYKFTRVTRGIREVSPAQKLTEKGILILKHQREAEFPGGKVTHFIWVKKE